MRFWGLKIFAGSPVAARVITGKSLARLKLVERQRVAPDTACVEADYFGVVGHALQRGPVTKNDCLAFGKPALVTEPGGDFFTRHGIGNRLRTFTDQIQLAFTGAVAHAGKVVGDDPESCHATQAVIPYEGVVAIHVG